MANALQNRVGKLWKQLKSRGETARKQLDRLMDERDRLLVKLGEQTLTWVNKSPVQLPGVVKQTVTRLNEVVESLKDEKAEHKAPATPSVPAAAPASAPAKKKAPKKEKAAAKPKPKAKKAAAKPAAKATAKPTVKPNKAPVGKKKLES